MLFLLPLLAACSSSSQPPSSPETPPLPTRAPITISVTAPEDAPVELDTTWGEVGWLHITDLSGAHPLLQTHLPGTGCTCDPDARCPEAARPAPSTIRVDAGARRDFTWDGLLQRTRMDQDDELCTEPVSPPEGRWRLATCDTTGTHCAHADIDLPASRPVLLALAGPQPPVIACPTGSELRLVRAHFLQLARTGLLEGTLSECDPDALTCVAPESLEARLEGARDHACSHWVIPRGEEIEVLTFRPLPRADDGSERFSTFFDPWGTELLRVDHGS